jgi:outer membrane receptor protein involved in Fe transport
MPGAPTCRSSNRTSFPSRIVAIRKRDVEPVQLLDVHGERERDGVVQPLRDAASTSIGAQYNKETVNGTQAAGEGLASGSSSVAGTTFGFAATQQNSDIITLGGYLQQKLAWRDRLYLTAAIRGDDNSAFGQDFKLVYYPSASVSWVIGDESWFPNIPGVSSLRLRGSVGQSGQRPGFRNAVSFFQAVGVRREVGDVGALELGPNIGNNELKPELSTEYEAGLDLGLAKSRVSLELTYYNKTSHDAIFNVTLAPSTGSAQTALRENLGSINNTGLEALSTRPSSMRTSSSGTSR